MKQIDAGHVCLALALLLAGCHSADSKVVGTWSDSVGVRTLKSDHTWSTNVKGYVFAGTWELRGDDAVFTTVSAAGKPVAEVKRLFLARALRYPKRAAQIRRIAEDLGKPEFYALSPDGQSMTTDKHLDQTTGPPETFKKQN